ncbi:MAG: endonuclease, partial [Bacteroidales bacterium]
DVPNGNPPYQYTFGVDQCGNYTTEGDCYNREHSVPKSWFNSASPMYSDLFHLYPTDGKVNQERGNYAFGEVGTPNYTSLNGSKRGNCDYPDCSGIVFEPINEYKGDLARSYFYMCTRYMDKNLGQNTNSMFTGGNLDHWALNMLIAWHQQDPVSQKEINRNNAIYQLQHNRNPFIDYPELVGKIFGNDSVNAFNPESSTIPFYNNEVKHFRIYPNPADKILRIVGEDKVVNEVEVLDMMGNVVIKHTVKMENQKTFVKDISHLTEGIYVVKIKSYQYLEIQKLMIQRDGSY